MGSDNHSNDNSDDHLHGTNFGTLQPPPHDQLQLNTFIRPTLTTNYGLPHASSTITLTKTFGQPTMTTNFGLQQSLLNDSNQLI